MEGDGKMEDRKVRARKIGICCWGSNGLKSRQQSLEKGELARPRVIRSDED